MVSEERRSVEVGGWTVTPLSDGLFRLDGGAMWGVVPATLWRPLTPPDEDNTILLALNCFLAERDGVRVVLEGGIGTRWSEKHQRIYRIQFVDSLRASLARLGLTPEDIDHVVLSHCHWDHCGGLVEEVEGQLEPVFPRAQVHAPQVEIDRCLDPDPVRAASYRADDLRPLLERGLLQGFEGSQTLLEGLEAHVLGGHSDGVSVLLLGEGDDRAIFWADVVPTTHHIQPPYIMAYDLNAGLSYEVRREWIERAADGGWLGLFYHDPEHPMARIAADGRRFVATPV